MTLMNLGGCGDGIAAASRSLSSYSAELDRELAAFRVNQNTGWSQRDRIAFVGGDGVQALRTLQEASRLPDDLVVLSLSHKLERDMAQFLGRGRLVSLGAREYSSQHRDEFRRMQRLLPIFETPWRVAVKSAVSENPKCPLLISLHLSLFSLADAPGAIGGGCRGLNLDQFFGSLDDLPTERVVAWHIWGAQADVGPECRTSRLGAEILREAILRWSG